MNTCRRCKTKTNNFKVLRFGGAGSDQLQSLGIGGRHNSDQDTYNITVCEECKASFLRMMLKWFRTGADESEGSIY